MFWCCIFSFYSRHYWTLFILLTVLYSLYQKHSVLQGNFLTQKFLKHPVPLSFYYFPPLPPPPKIIKIHLLSRGIVPSYIKRSSFLIWSDGGIWVVTLIFISTMLHKTSKDILKSNIPEESNMFTFKPKIESMITLLLKIEFQKS